VLLNLYQLAKRIGILNESNKSGDFAVGEWTGTENITCQQHIIRSHSLNDNTNQDLKSNVFKGKNTQLKWQR
jgi:hypothetical protein